jgi:prevent-host-death family protein
MCQEFYIKLKKFCPDELFFIIILAFLNSSCYTLTRLTSAKQISLGGVYMNAQLKNDMWQLQDAKARFSEVIKSCAKAPQIITVRGEETAVILSMDKYRKLTEPKQTLWEFFQNSPLRDVELEEMPREPFEMRDIDL